MSIPPMSKTNPCKQIACDILAYFHYIEHNSLNLSISLVKYPRKTTTTSLIGYLKFIGNDWLGKTNTKVQHDAMQ